MHLQIMFLLDFFILSILTLVSLIKGQAVWSNTQNANRRTGLDPRIGFTSGYQPSGSETYGLREAVPNLNYKESSYSLQSGSDFYHPFNEPGGYALSPKFSDESYSFISPTRTSANRRGIYDWVAQFGPRSNYRNQFNMQQAEGNTANSGLGNVPVNNQNSGFNNDNFDMTTFPGGTAPGSNRNVVFNSGSLNKGSMKTLASGNMPGSDQNAVFNNGPLSNTETETFFGGPVALPGNIGNENFPTAIDYGVLPSKLKNNQGFAHELPFNPAVLTSENSRFDKTTPDKATISNTSNEEQYKILQETTEVRGRKQASQKKISGIKRRSRSKNRSRRKSSQHKTSSVLDVQDGQDIIHGTDVKNTEKETNDNISTATPETSSMHAKKDLPSFLASAVNQFDTPSTVHYISAAVSLLVSDEEFDLASLPSVILALTMQIRSAFPGLPNSELLNQVFLELIIALGHILKYSKVGDVDFESIAETAELVMKAF